MDEDRSDNITFREFQNGLTLALAGKNVPLPSEVRRLDSASTLTPMIHISTHPLHHGAHHATISLTLTLTLWGEG